MRCRYHHSNCYNLQDCNRIKKLQRKCVIEVIIAKSNFAIRDLAVETRGNSEMQAKDETTTDENLLRFTNIQQFLIYDSINDFLFSQNDVPLGRP